MNSHGKRMLQVDPGYKGPDSTGQSMASFFKGNSNLVWVASQEFYIYSANQNSIKMAIESM